LGGFAVKFQSARRAMAVGIAVAVIPATVALAAGTSSTPKAAPASVTAPTIYPFGDNCVLHSPASSYKPAASGGGTWTVNPKLTCKNLKLRMTILAGLHKNGHVIQGSSGQCVVGLNVHTCHSVEGKSHSLRMNANQAKGKWYTLVRYTIQGADAFFWFDHHRASCKYEVAQTTTRCTYVVDNKTIA
jgi:hypothetical protein